MILCRSDVIYKSIRYKIQYLKYINTAMAKKLSGSAVKKMRLEEEERESGEIIKKKITQKLDNFFFN